AMLFSTAVMSAYQAVTAGIGYWIFGVDSPLVWASLTGIASILPAVGTALVWAPVGIVMLLIGRVAQGIGILLWSLVVVVDVDDPAFHEGSPVVHAHADRGAVLEVLDAQTGTKCHRRMGGGQLFRIEALAAGRPVPAQSGPVVGGDAFADGRIAAARRNVGA